MRKKSENLFTPVKFTEIPELVKARSLFENIKKKFNALDKVDKKIYCDDYLNDIIIVLSLVGEMTDKIFSERDNIEEKYFKLESDPEMAKRLFLSEYSSKHKPYDDIKNHGWDIYEEIFVYSNKKNLSNNGYF